jgi:hypothetical protein
MEYENIFNDTSKIYDYDDVKSYFTITLKYINENPVYGGPYSFNYINEFGNNIMRKKFHMEKTIRDNIINDYKIYNKKNNNLGYSIGDHYKIIYGSMNDLLYNYMNDKEIGDVFKFKLLYMKAIKDHINNSRIDINKIRNSELYDIAMMVNFENN